MLFIHSSFTIEHCGVRSGMGNVENIVWDASMLKKKNQTHIGIRMECSSFVHYVEHLEQKTKKENAWEARTCSVERIDSGFVSTSFCLMTLYECWLSTLVCEFLDFVLVFFPHKGRRVYTTIPVYFNSDSKSLYNYF